MEIRSILNRQNAEITAMVQVFEDELRTIVSRAQSRLAAYLGAKLTVENGVIRSTPANLKVVRTLDRVWTEYLDEAGYSALVKSFTREFAGQIPYLQEVFGQLSKAADSGLPKLTFTIADLNVFSAYRLNAEAGLDSVLEGAVALTMQRALFSLGGMKFQDLITTLADHFGASIPKATSLADTAMATFYRVASDRAFQKIAEGAPQELRFRYIGPDDKKTRLFCHRLEQADKSYTRAEIAAMKNGQMPNVFVTCGGWNCRHVWILDTRKT